MATLQEMFEVNGKSVIVTGGASGIGRAYAEVMADSGARVCIFDLDGDRLDSVVADLKARGGEVWGQALDVADRLRMASGFDEVAARHGRIDVVFANAGIDFPRALLTCSMTIIGIASSRSISLQFTLPSNMLHAT
jgi:NAD(P)-dependent dehydrogenase (short-subunit alcohol dehydrogenase family)